MEASLILQYIIVALLVAGALYWVVNLISKNFSGQKFRNSKPGCDRDCCS